MQYMQLKRVQTSYTFVCIYYNTTYVYVMRVDYLTYKLFKSTI